MPKDKSNDEQQEIQAQIKDLKAASFDDMEYIGKLQEAANQAQARIQERRAQIEKLTRQISAETEKEK